MIKNTWLGFGLYKLWNIKVILPNNELKNLQDKLHTYAILEFAETDVEIE